METTIIIGALGALALLGAGLTGWGMWLEHRAERRLMDIVAAALEAGQAVPGELLGRLAGEHAGNSATPRRALLRTASLFLGLALAFFLGSWAVGDNAREQALLLVAAIAGLSGLALLVVHFVGRRVGL
jgi:hypothetical protein